MRDKFSFERCEIFIWLNKLMEYHKQLFLFKGTKLLFLLHNFNKSNEISIIKSGRFATMKGSSVKHPNGLS
jgi:hypothetical protein